MKSLAKALLLSMLRVYWTSIANGEPVQYCKRVSKAGVEEIDFCMGALMHRNTSSNAHDLFLTMTIPRHGSSDLGWTAIGPGTGMDGALMFIIYGDPRSHKGPIVSIRTTDGHHQPILLTLENVPGGMDLRIIRSSWLSDDSHEIQDQTHSSYTGWVNLVCYSCHLWQGTDISAHSTSQPWIWAWNPKQKFDIFSLDAHLDMHKHHAGAGGWGNFYLDMSRSISTAEFPPSLPPIRPQFSSLGASDTPMSFRDSVFKMIVGPGSYFHGVLLAAVFLLLFPAGLFSLRAGHSRSFTYHWIIQSCASLLLMLGLGLGLLKSRNINTFHQWVGITLALSAGAQGLLGWWHHRIFIRLHRRTWVSYLHIWLGRLVMAAGASNVVSGLLLRGYGKGSTLVVLLMVIICLEVVGLSGWMFWMQRERGEYATKPMWSNTNDGHFVVSTSDDEDDDSELKAECEKNDVGDSL